MLSRCVRYALAITLMLALSSAGLWAAKDFVPPHPENANTYAAKDAHPAEKVTVAIELYDSPPKNNIFITSYGQNGILPVFLIVSNDGNQPITVNNMRVQLVTAGRTKLESLDVDDVFRRIGHIGGSSNGPQRVGPIPLPGGNKNKKAQKQYQEILNARFAAEAVEPHTTKSGFLFFDIAGVREPVVGAHIYLTGLRDAGGADLMYFEIPTIASNAATGQ